MKDIDWEAVAVSLQNQSKTNRAASEELEPQLGVTHGRVIIFGVTALVLKAIADALGEGIRNGS